MKDMDVFQNVTVVDTEVYAYTLDDDLISLEIPKGYS